MCNITEVIVCNPLPSIFGFVHLFGKVESVITFLYVQYFHRIIWDNFSCIFLVVDYRVSVTSFRLVVYINRFVVCEWFVSFTLSSFFTLKLTH
jgi:hypothetical protein